MLLSAVRFGVVKHVQLLADVPSEATERGDNPTRSRTQFRRDVTALLAKRLCAQLMTAMDTVANEFRIERVIHVKAFAIVHSLVPHGNLL